MKNKPHLKEGEIICNKCKGEGEIVYDNIFAIWCSKCRGTGKVDWISNAMNKEVGVKIWGQKTLRKYNDEIIISNKGVSDTTFPIGTTSTSPVNNVADALKIAKERGFI